VVQRVPQCLTKLQEALNQKLQGRSA
jgi:hypothetical protein